jgi:hypothetical protein
MLANVAIFGIGRFFPFWIIYVVPPGPKCTTIIPSSMKVQPVGIESSYCCGKFFT